MQNAIRITNSNNANMNASGDPEPLWILLGHFSQTPLPLIIYPALHVAHKIPSWPSSHCVVFIALPPIQCIFPIKSSHE